MQDPITCVAIHEEYMKNTSNIFNIMVAKIQGNKLIYLADKLNIFQIMGGTCKLYKILVAFLVTEYIQIIWNNIHICYR